MTLWFRDSRRELDYLRQSDPEFRHHVTCALLLYLASCCVQLDHSVRSVQAGGRRVAAPSPCPRDYPTRGGAVSRAKCHLGRGVYSAPAQKICPAH